MTSKQTATKKRRSPAGAARAARPYAQGATVPRSPAARRRRAPTSAASITPEERYRLIAEAAYHRARQRGFAAGGELQDWLEAESEVDAHLREA